MKIDVLEEFIALASLNSPSGHEAPVAAYLLGKLRQLGLSAIVDDSAARTGSDTGNILVRIPGNAAGPAILLCAHMDTVAPTAGMVPVRRDGTIYSNGETILGADDKVGIAIMLALLPELISGATPHGDVEILFTVQEEVGLCGASALTAELKADFGYILDGDGPVGNVINQAPSKVDLDFTVEGQAAHAGRPDTGINAIVAAAAAIARLRTGRIDVQTTSNVGVISGGKARNIVPDRAEVAVEVRSTDKDRLEREVQAILDTFTAAVAINGARLNVQQSKSFETYTLPESHPVVANAFLAARSLDITPALWTSGGGTDANIFNTRGLASVGLGLGVEDAHSPREHITVAQLETGVRYIRALLTEAVTSPGAASPSAPR